MFNMDDGYFEGLVRGFRAGILKQADYMNLCQCETLDGTMLFPTARLILPRLEAAPANNRLWQLSPKRVLPACCVCDR